MALYVLSSPEAGIIGASANARTAVEMAIEYSGAGERHGNAFSIVQRLRDRNRGRILITGDASQVSVRRFHQDQLPT